MKRLERLLECKVEDKWKTVRQFVGFAIVGFSNTFISLLIYYILVYFGVNYIVGNTVAFTISVLNSYYWNNKFVFKKGHKKHLQSITKTFIAYGTTFLLSTILLIMMVDCLKISPIVAPLINLIITIPLNFILNKFWAFK